MEKKHKFVIEPSEARALMESAGLSNIADLLPTLVPTAQSLARPPISSFPVGCVGLGSTGRIYLGCNLEFPGLPLHHSVHAEQFLVANASAHDEPQIQFIAVSAAPCGHCRQFFQELRDAARLQILVTSDPDPAYRPLIGFLPRPFGPVDLLENDVPFLLEGKRGGVGGDGDGDGGFSIGSVNENGWGGVEGKAVGAAMEAARRAHAPYSGCASGFAVVDGEGRVYSGSYMESAAYNPSLGPVQAAMVGYLVGGGEGWDGIVGAALVEAEGAKVEHEATARVFFNKVAPEAKIWVRRFRLGW